MVMSIYSILLMALSAVVAIVAAALTKKLFRRPQEPVIKSTETSSLPVKPAEGLFNYLLKDTDVVINRICTTEDIEVSTGETLYYLIEGVVEVIYDRVVIIKKTEDFFVYSINWLLGVSSKQHMTYKIQRNSQLYQINKNDATVRYLLLNRFFKGTLYIMVNYLEEGMQLDIKQISVSAGESHKELVQKIKEKIELVKPVERAEEIVIDGRYEMAPNTLLYIIEGSGEVEYTRDSKKSFQKGDIIGCLEQVCSLKNNRVIVAKEKTVGTLIKLEPSLEASTESLEVVLQDILNGQAPVEQLEMTDVMVDWRIIQPGGRLSSEEPSKSIKVITNGYFLKNGDVKYFGISSRNILFEKEVLLEQPSAFELTATRISEVIEIPKEYITTIASNFPALSNGLYKRILERTGIEQELEQPSIITFIPNDKKETQLEIFTHFLCKEMAKNDSCFILSSTEIENKLKSVQKTKSAVLSLLNYISDLQREYSYILIPIVDPNCTITCTAQSLPQPTKPEESSADRVNSDPAETTEDTKKDSMDGAESKEKEKPLSSEDNEVLDKSKASEIEEGSVEKSEEKKEADLDPILLSEIMFYVITNGDRRSMNINKEVFCKIDTLILHRDSRMKVYGGNYYGQRHNVEFPIIDIPLSIIKSRDSVNYTNKHCKLTGHSNDWIPYFPLNDMHRFIRTLKGTNVGLVLGGGGARGIAHIGIIEALEEANIPIDAIGGTSMGAFVGALYAERTNNKEVFIRAKRLTGLIGSVWRVIFDMTYPICAMFTGKSFNWALRLIFKNQRIEDLWLPYYCITTDISGFEEKKHTDGILWRYVRASMSLSGYLPPLCDNGSFLLDGGYMNNVPADAMRSMGIRNIIAVDVGSEVETTFADYGDSINGFYILFQKIFSTKKFLSLTEIQYRLAYLTSMHKERSLKSDVSIKYIRPDLAGYKTMNFRQFDEIVAHGYQYGKKVIAEWKNTGEYSELTTLTRAPSRK
ncbi:lysophospholipid hydrolase [Nematocida parisii]|nr:lysophospholipid hydrolase [Nematocida parisii]